MGQMEICAEVARFIELVSSLLPSLSHQHLEHPEDQRGTSAGGVRPQ